MCQSLPVRVILHLFTSLGQMEVLMNRTDNKLDVTKLSPTE